MVNAGREGAREEGKGKERRKGERDRGEKTPPLVLSLRISRTYGK